MKKLILIIPVLLNIFSSVAQDYKNSINLNASNVCFSDSKNNRVVFIVPEINYLRRVGENFQVGISYSRWINSFAPISSNVGDLSLREKNFYVEPFVGLSKKLKNHSFGFYSGPSFSSGVNHYIKYFSPTNSIDYGGSVMYQPISEKKHENLVGGFMMLEYNYFILKGRFNIGIHSKTRLFSKLPWEFDYGIHAGVNF